MNFLANLLAAIGNAAASFGTQGCYAWIVDEPKMPKSLLDK